MCGGAGVTLGPPLPARDRTSKNTSGQRPSILKTPENSKKSDRKTDISSQASASVMPSPFARSRTASSASLMVMYGRSSFGRRAGSAIPS